MTAEPLADAELGLALLSAWSEAASRMADLPVYNPALDVRVTDVRRRGDWRIAVVVTPWFMNVVAVPDAAVALPADGAKLSLDLPAGAVELVVATLPAIGRYGAASLFSPMDDFTDAETAWATAVACLDQLCTPPKPPESGPLATPVDRRSLFRFGLGGSRR